RRAMASVVNSVANTVNSRNMPPMELSRRARSARSPILRQLVTAATLSRESPAARQTRLPRRKTPSAANTSLEHPAAACPPHARVADDPRLRKRPRQVLCLPESAPVVLAVFADRQPFLGNGRKRRRETRIGTRAVYDLSPDHGEEGLDVLDPVIRDLEV